MRDRIERELGADPTGKRLTGDLKVGAGGVIDVEFAAQYLQLVHGHAHPALRTTGTAAALEAAAAAGVAPAGDVELLAQGYRFLRKIEHRLRVVHDQPIHRLPEARGELDKLARRSGPLIARPRDSLPRRTRCLSSVRNRCAAAPRNRPIGRVLR
jgi:glutamate-ammonia-ligase adenylyltransferase